MKFVNQSNFPKFMHLVGETNTKPSLTVPGMTMSLDELLKRYVRGDSVNIFTPTYLGEDDLPNIERMDAMDRLDLAHSLQSELKTSLSRTKSSNVPPSPDLSSPHPEALEM